MSADRRILHPRPRCTRRGGGLRSLELPSRRDSAAGHSSARRRERGRRQAVRGGASLGPGGRGGAAGGPPLRACGACAGRRSCGAAAGRVAAGGHGCDDGLVRNGQAHHVGLCGRAEAARTRVGREGPVHRLRGRGPGPRRQGRGRLLADELRAGLLRRRAGVRGGGGAGGVRGEGGGAGEGVRGGERARQRLKDRADGVGEPAQSRVEPRRECDRRGRHLPARRSRRSREAGGGASSWPLLPRDGAVGCAAGRANHGGGDVRAGGRDHAVRRRGGDRRRPRKRLRVRPLRVRLHGLGGKGRSRRRAHQDGPGRHQQLAADQRRRAMPVGGAEGLRLRLPQRRGRVAAVLVAKVARVRDGRGGGGRLQGAGQVVRGRAETALGATQCFLFFSDCPTCFREINK
mmetsp:Transcript_49631/g.159772  ORF Transcript_49631/g.159772 Transcript_49631/m.159772 type:complete len:403 (+) Transcript_49631:483-1691(+)